MFLSVSCWFWLALASALPVLILRDHVEMALLSQPAAVCCGLEHLSFTPLLVGHLILEAQGKLFPAFCFLSEFFPCHLILSHTLFPSVEHCRARILLS